MRGATGTSGPISGPGPAGPGVPSRPTSDGAGLDAILEVVGDSPATGSPHAFLLVVGGAEPGRLHVLEKPELVIGRSKYADIRISERAMSQQHAKIVRTGEGHRLFDLGSTNGTFVNDQQVESADLRPGDMVRTGETVFTYMSAGSSMNPTAGDTTLALPSRSKRVRTTPGVPLGAARPSAAPLVVRPHAGPAQIPAPPHVINAPAMPAHGPEDGADMLGMIIRVLEFARRYWRSITIFTVAGVGLGIASYKVSKPPATATFEIQLIPKPTDNLMERGRRMNFEFFRSAQKSFVRPALIRKSLKALGHEDVDAGDLRKVRDRLTLVQGNKRTGKDVYAGSFQAASGEDALEYLRVHLSFFLDDEIDKALKVLLVEVETLETKLAAAEEDLSATDQAVMAFKQEHSEGLPDQAQQLYQELISLRSERGGASSEVARASEELRARRRQLKSEAPEIESRIELARPYEDAIADVNRELAAARAAGKGPQHPDVVRLKKQRKSLELERDNTLKSGGSRIVRARNPLYEGRRLAKDDAEASLRIAQTELGRLTNDIERTRKLVDELPRLQREYAELTRSYDATKKVYERLFDKLNSSRIQLDMERASVSARYDITTPPNVEPVSKIKTIITRAGALGFVGFAFGVLLGIARDLRRVISTRLAQQRAR